MTIRVCDQRDRDPSKPAAEQKICLFTKDGKRLLGRHPDEESAKQQEAAIHARGARTNMKRQCIKLAEVPESAVKSLYDQKWGESIMTQLGEDFPVDAKSAQFLFHSVWNAVIQLMDKSLMQQDVDTTEFTRDPTFMQSLAGLAYFVTDDAIKSSLGLKSDSLQKGKGHAEALMQVLGKEADVDQTLQGLKKQAVPIVEKAFDQVTSYLKDQPEQKAASIKWARPEVFCAFVRQADSSDVAAAIRPLIKEALQKYDAWFDSEAGDHYSREFDRLVEDWAEEVAAIVYWAEESGTGDITNLSDLVYIPYIAEILFKLSPDWETPDARENLQRDLEDIEESVMDIAFETAANQLRSAEAQTKTAVGWDRLPKGWTKESVQKFWDGLTGDRKHKVTACIKKMEGKVDDAGGFCAGIADMIPEMKDWRKEPRKSKTADKPLKGEPIRLQDLVDAAERAVEPTSRKAALKPSDKKVVDAFMNKQAQDGRILSTDGQVLETMGMGGGVAVARWVDDHGVSILNEYSSRTEQSVANYMRKTVPKKMQQQHSYREAALIAPEATTAMTSPKSADQMVREWVHGLPRDAAGYASVWLYGMVAMDAPADEWLETAEHEGLYIPAGQRNVPYIQEFLREELNDQTAVQLDTDTQAGQVGSFVYAEQEGYWGLMYETPAVEDVLSAMGRKPKQQRAAVVPTSEAAPEIAVEVTPEATPPEVAPKQLRHQGQLYREATEEEVLARKTDRRPNHRPRGRDSRAPSMQLTQQISKLPKEKSRREPAAEEPEKDSLLKRGLKWLDRKSHEADVSPRTRWGRLRKADAHKSIDKRNATKQTGCGCERQERTMNKTANLDNWAAVLDVARDCGAEAARQDTRPVPEWTGEPILQYDWDAIEDVLGAAWDSLDSGALRELEDVWMEGFDAERARLNNTKRKANTKRNAETIHRDPDYSGIGKFDSNVDEHVYELALEGWAAITIGDVQELGHFDLVVFEPGDPLVAVYGDHEDVSAAAIVMEDNQGFVRVTYYNSEQDATLEWEEIEADYEDFYRDVEEHEHARQ